MNQFLVWLLVSLCIGGSIGLGSVWMRHQISALANANRLLEARFADVQRHIDETTTAIEVEQGSDVLRRRNADWGLGLRPVTDAQLVRVTEDPVMRLAQRHNREIFSDGVPAVSFRIALKN